MLIFFFLFFFTVFDAAEVTDQRSFEGFMNLEAPGQPTFEEYVRVGPLIGVSPLQIFLLSVRTSC